MTERQKRKIKEIQSNPEMMQAREELKEEFINTHPQYAQMTIAELQESMTRHTLEDEKLRKQKLRNHIEAFADGIIAVIITIMLLEIPVPTGNQGYWEFLSSVGIFLVSFVVTANFWFNRHKIFALTEEITEKIIIQDFIFIGLLSLIPLLTKWIMVAPTAFSALNFGLVLIVILLQQELLSYSITKDHFHKMPKSFKFWRRVWLIRLFSTILMNIVIMIIAIIFPYYGHWLFVIVPVFNFLFHMVNDRNQEEETYAATRSVGVPYLKEG
ncbi:TMEM175 family protein [Lactococcus hircilactis]